MTGAEPTRPPFEWAAGLPPTLEWVGDTDGYLRVLDQTRLPVEVVTLDCTTAEDVWRAIRSLAVRGAPLIGVAASYALCLGLREHRAAANELFLAKLRDTAAYLKSCRPTAVNLAWAVDRVAQVAASMPVATVSAVRWRAMLAEAHRIAEEDRRLCRRIGEHGAALVPDNGGVMTHCNAGALATMGFGTALAPLYVAHQTGRRFRVFAPETRPLLQGARLTAFELSAAGIDVTLLCDSAAACLLRSGSVQLVIVGADRIAENGDTANKIGTYALALAARRHAVPFYVAAPSSTFDLAKATGADIPIEERPEDEVRAFFGRQVAPRQIRCFNPAFDVTPAELIRGIITEAGVIEPVSASAIRRVLDEAAARQPSV